VTDISQGCIVTCLRYRVICNSIFIANLLATLMVKEFSAADNKIVYSGS